VATPRTPRAVCTVNASSATILTLARVVAPVLPSGSIAAAAAAAQGLTLVHFQLNLIRLRHTIHPTHRLISASNLQTPPKQSLNATPIPQKALKLS